MTPDPRDRAKKLRATERRMVTERCSNYTGHVCLLTSNDWSKPMCPRCTAILLCRDLAVALGVPL